MGKLVPKTPYFDKFWAVFPNACAVNGETWHTEAELGFDPALLTIHLGPCRIGSPKLLLNLYVGQLLCCEGL